jgi:hypothetical protein
VEADPDLSWLPDEDRKKLLAEMAEWTGPGRGYVLVICRPAPDRDGYVIFQPCVEPESPQREDCANDHSYEKTESI